MVDKGEITRPCPKCGGQMIRTFPCFETNMLVWLCQSCGYHTEPKPIDFAAHKLYLENWQKAQDAKNQPPKDTLSEPDAGTGGT